MSWFSSGFILKTSSISARYDSHITEMIALNIDAVSVSKCADHFQMTCYVLLEYAMLRFQ